MALITSDCARRTGTVSVKTDRPRVVCPRLPFVFACLCGGLGVTCKHECCRFSKNRVAIAGWAAPGSPTNLPSQTLILQQVA